MHYVAAYSAYLERYYRERRDKRGTGRARIAVIRKLCGMMRRSDRRLDGHQSGHYSGACSQEDQLQAHADCSDGSNGRSDCTVAAERVMIINNEGLGKPMNEEQ